MVDRILITGSAGFLGSHLSRTLAKEGKQTFGFSRSLGNELSDPDCFKPFFAKGVSTVIHLAGRTFIPQSWKEPTLFYQTNTLGTARVLEFCKSVGARMIFVSSYVYGAPQYLPIDEDHPVRPANPYTHSRWLGEEICRFYHQNFSVPVTILRPFNIFGPGQGDWFLIPKIISHWAAGQEVELEDLTPKRDFLFVSDFVEACLSLLNRNDEFSVFNIGFGRSYSVEEIVETVRELAGEFSGVRPFSFRVTGEQRKNQISDVVARCSLTESGIWSPRVSLREGLRRVMDFCSASCRSRNELMGRPLDSHYGGNGL